MKMRKTSYFVLDFISKSFARPDKIAISVGIGYFLIIICSSFHLMPLLSLKNSHFLSLKYYYIKK